MKNIYIELVNKFSTFLKGLSKEDIINLEQQKIFVRFEIVSNNGKNDIIGLGKLIPEKIIDLDEVIGKLYKFNSRAGGEEYLELQCPKRLDLEKIAKKLDVPFSKKDSIQKLKNKIIERTIGFRLRSEAIQG